MTDCLILNDILGFATKINASDIHLKVYSVPVFRINGQLVKVEELGNIKPETMNSVLELILSESQKKRFAENNEIDLSYSVSGVGRFRVNVFKQRGSVGIVFRLIPFSVKSIEELLLPPVVKQIAMFNRGLILVTGTTGSGKSTTMASMIDYINNTKTANVVTIEDPIEYLVRDKKSIVNQREIGIDTISFSNALRAALRQDPDIIMVGEMRDLETIEVALTAAETGHLVISTLHTLDAAETINRIISVFPPHQQGQIRHQLSSVFRATISMRLMRKKDNRGRVPAIEVLLGTTLVREIILDPSRYKELHDVIQKGYTTYGMQTFDQSIYQLFKSGFISQKEALKNATYPDDLELRMKGVSISGDGDWGSFDKDNRQYNDDFDIE